MCFSFDGAIDALQRSRVSKSSLPLRPCNPLFTAVRRQSFTQPSTEPRYKRSACTICEVIGGRHLQPATRRAFRRCAFVASAEVTDTVSRTRLSARTSELGLGGCYVDSLNPFPAGTLVQLRILRDQGVFETEAKVVYCDPRFGMGLAFAGIKPEQRSLLEAWLTELVAQLK